MFLNKQKGLDIYFKMPFMKSVKVEYHGTNVSQSLILIERVVLYNLSLYENINDKITFLSDYYNGLISKVFRKKNYIIETFKYKFTDSIIIESNYDVRKRISEMHNFIKKVIKFEYLTEQQNFEQPKSTVNYQATDVQGNANTSRATSVDVLKRIGWDEFFRTLKDGLSSTIFTLGKEVLKFLFPAVGAGVKISGYFGWTVLFLYDIYRNKLSEAIGDFFSLLASMIPGPLSSKVKEIVELTKGLAYTTVDVTVKKIIEALGLKEMMAKLAGSIAQLASSILDILTSSAKWIETQFGNTTKIFSQTLSKAKEFVDEIIKSINDYVKNFDIKTANLGSVVTDTFKSQGNNVPKTPVAQLVRKPDIGKI